MDAAENHSFGPKSVINYPALHCNKNVTFNVFMMTQVVCVWNPFFLGKGYSQRTLSLKAYSLLIPLTVSININRNPPQFPLFLVDSAPHDLRHDTLGDTSGGTFSVTLSTPSGVTRRPLTSRAVGIGSVSLIGEVAGRSAEFMRSRVLY